MYLKRLESVGFKSFAERISVDFVNGMTAVVGPNGSGKSNITDAIRWVLGEQSVKSLRGSKMEDIIFQGSDTRKPLNFAEVKLVLDNSNHDLPIDYEEVNILRRVYRSGASEFYINKQSCRLKDIIDLFMDSGLGREAFSIISQGKVEEVLSSKAEERRTIFEEAAGVLKYKQRKQKAEYKLAETEENLNRVNDIIYEIDQQIEPLSEQARKAKEFIKLKEYLTKEEISLLITEIEDLHQEWQTCLEELEIEKTKELKLKTDIQIKGTEVEVKRNKIQEIDESVEKLQDQLLAITQYIEQSEGKRHVLTERLKHFSENKQKTIALKEEVIQQIENFQHRLQEEQTTLRNLKDKKQATEAKIKTLKKELMINKADIREQIEDQKSEYIEILSNQAAKRNELQSIHNQLERLSGKHANQTVKYQTFIEQQGKLESRKAELHSELVTVRDYYNRLQKEVANLKVELANKRNTLERYQGNLSKGYQMIAKLNSKKDMLEEMKEGFQGFYYGVKNILKARDNKQLDHIQGAVIELIAIPKDYIAAIEAALGAQAQYIVVMKKEQAREAIAWLKQTNSGRATFLPLDAIESRTLANSLIVKIKKHTGFIGVAADLVNTDHPYKKVVNHLMGHVIIAKTLKDANEIAELLNHRNRIVTLDGDVVNPGGSMSGGARNKSTQSLFTRDNDLLETQEMLKDHQEKAIWLDKKLTKEKQAISQIEENQLSKEEQIYETQSTLQELQSSYNKTDMELATLQANIEEFDRSKQQSQNDQDQLTTEKKVITNDLNEIEQQLVDIQTLIDQLTKKENQHQENKQHMEHALHEFQVSLAEQVERERNQQDKTRSIENELTDLQGRFESITHDIQAFADYDQLQETRNDLKVNIEEKNNEKNEITNQIQAKRNERHQMTQLLHDLERELKEESKHQQRYLEMIQKQEVQINRLDVSLENKLSHLESEYKVTYEKARQTYERVEDVNVSKQSVAELNEKISLLGSVNLGAIDEYERLSSRYEFLMEQKDDLIKAKETLYSIITEMDQVMKERFELTFGQIREEFSFVFVELFGGGRAELNLTDPSNVLETGIDIIAQPPGKKLQHLGLLSGGERALTAIALLFAILRVRPVPFCVLDEVEAALDEANVVRFAKYLKQHSDSTQFIVITHRKGTMEEADVLYGVTMQESGVSRLVSVQLEDTTELVSS